MLILLSVWAVAWSLVVPIRQAFMNGLIPSEHRATVLSADNMVNSAGGVIAQPTLGKIADVWGYGTWDDAERAYSRLATRIQQGRPVS